MTRPRAVMNRPWCLVNQTPVRSAVPQLPEAATGVRMQTYMRDESSPYHPTQRANFFELPRRNPRFSTCPGTRLGWVLPA